MSLDDMNTVCMSRGSDTHQFQIVRISAQHVECSKALVEIECKERLKMHWLRLAFCCAPLLL
jgi:hypothetical protein